MSIKLMTQVWESDIGPATKRLVLLALADSANDEGVCWPSVATIARKAGASKRRTEEVLAELASAEVVTKRARWNDSNVYTLNLADLGKDSAEATPRESRAPREEVGDPPAKSAGPPREEVGPNRKRTQIEPKDPVASAPELPLDLPHPERQEYEQQPVPTLNQLANALATEHYEAVAKMGSFMAFRQVMRKALDASYTPARISQAARRLRDRNMPLTAQALRIELEGGIRRQPPVPESRPVVRTGRNGRGPVLEGYEG
jgi:hypothetical protein